MIDFYFAGCETSTHFKLAASEKVNILMSYWALGNFENWKTMYNDCVKDYTPKIIIDSGAFSAWTRGKVIDVDEYIEFLNNNEEWFTLYGQIDTIPGTREGNPPTIKEVSEAAGKTWDNYLYMRERLKNPDKLLYTFHVGEPLNQLKEALEWKDENGQGMKYMALGGMVGKNAFVRESFLESCFHIIENSSNPNVKVHGFGMTSNEVMRKFPLTSVDSTSWILTAAMGSIMTDVGSVVISEVQSNHKNSKTSCEVSMNNLEELIKPYGINLEELKTSCYSRQIYHLRYLTDKANKLECRRLPKKKKLF